MPRPVPTATLPTGPPLGNIGLEAMVHVLSLLPIPTFANFYSTYG